METAPDGKSLILEGAYMPDESPKKIKKKFNWVADTPDVLIAKIKEYGHLSSKEKLTEDDDFKDYINPNSYGEMPVYVEPVSDMPNRRRWGFACVC